MRQHNFFSLDTGVGLSQIPSAPANALSQLGCLCLEKGDDLAHVFAGRLDLDCGVFPVPTSSLSGFETVANKHTDGPKAEVVFCLADFAIFGNPLQAVVSTAPGRIARRMSYKVEAVVIFEISSGDLYDIAGFDFNTCLLYTSVRHQHQTQAERVS